MNWTDKKITQLKELWKKGTIAEEIAEGLGTSKGAVIGKASRLGCASRKLGRLPGVLKQHWGYIKRPTRGRKEVLAGILLEMEPENPTSLESLTSNQCKFPLGKEKDPIDFFCGRERWIGSRKHGPNYCKYHTYVAAKLEDPRKAIQP